MNLHRSKNDVAFVKSGVLPPIAFHCLLGYPYPLPLRQRCFWMVPYVMILLGTGTSKIWIKTKGIKKIIENYDLFPTIACKFEG